MTKGIRNVPFIQDAPAHWRVLNIVNGFEPRTFSLKSIDNYEQYKVLVLKKEGKTSHMCQRYDQYAAKNDNFSFRDNTYSLCSLIPATREVLNYL